MNNRNIQDLLDATAYDNAGEKLGGVKEVFVNDETGQPDFVEVSHGLFGMNSSLVPLRGHRWEGEDLHLAFSKEAIKDAPNIDTDAHISDSEQATIYRHYNLDAVDHTQNYEPDYRRDAQADNAVAGSAAGAAFVNETHDGQTDRVELNNDGEPAFDQRAGVHQTAPGEHHVVDHRGRPYEGDQAPAVGGAGQPAEITPEQEAQARAQRSESSYTQHDPADGPLEHTLPSEDHGAAAATAGVAGAGGAGLAADAAYGDDRTAGEPEEIHVHHTYDNSGDHASALHDEDVSLAERNNLPDEEKTIAEERAAGEGMIRLHRYERRTDIDPSLR